MVVTAKAMLLIGPRKMVIWDDALPFERFAIPGDVGCPRKDRHIPVADFKA